MATSPPIPAPAPHRRRTLASEVSLSGTGLFSALPSTLTIRPSPAGTGIHFRRTDLPDQPLIPAHVSHVFARPRQTVLSPDPQPAAGPAKERSAGPAVHTVEHVLSAIAALGVTDALLELNGPEVPLLDGSALPFVGAIRRAGVVEVAPAAGPQPLPARRAVTLSMDGGTIQALPAEGPWLEVEYYLDYGAGAPIPPQSARFTVRHDAPDAAAYEAQIAPARTFCTNDEANAMQRAGLFVHLKARDVLVIGDEGPKDTSYRMDSEPARHKVLDVIGDLALAARPIHARVIATRSGHALNHALVRALLESE